MVEGQLGRAQHLLWGLLGSRGDSTTNEAVAKKEQDSLRQVSCDMAEAADNDPDNVELKFSGEPPLEGDSALRQPRAGGFAGQAQQGTERGALRSPRPLGEGGPAEARRAR